MNKQTSSEVRVHSGQVQAVAQNSHTRYGIRVNNAWHEGIGKCPVKKGDAVEIAYKERGRFRDVVDIRPASLRLGEPVPTGFGTSDKGVFVAKCVALKACATFYANSGGSLVALAKASEALAKWLLRSLDDKREEKPDDQSNGKGASTEASPTGAQAKEGDGERGR